MSFWLIVLSDMLSRAEVIGVLIAAFFVLFGMFIIRLGHTKRITLQDRLDGAGRESLVRSEERESYLSVLQRKLEIADVGITIPVYFLIMVVSMVVLYIIVNFLLDSPIIAFFCSLVSAYVPHLVVDMLVAKRKSDFDMMFVKSLKRLASSIRAGESLEQAVQAVINMESMPKAIRVQYERCLSDYSVGGDMAQAFEDMAGRTENEDVKGVATGIRIATGLGSQLDAIFDSFADTITSRKEMEAEGRSLLSSTRMDTLIMACVPFGFSVMMKIMQPGYFTPAYEWLGGLGRYILVLFYAAVVGGTVFLLKKCNIRI